jgi:hypothetical protein
MERKVQIPQFEIGQLLRAAAIANINTRDIPSNTNPWCWEDPRAFTWQSAYRSLNPVGAQDAEIHYGKPLSLALEAALEGIEPMTADLAIELSIKRPHRHEEMRQAQIEEALAAMEETLAAEAARRAEATQTLEEHKRALVASHKVAARQLRSQQVESPEVH